MTRKPYKHGPHSQPLRAWKGIAERLERDYPPYERPAAITRPLTKTGKPRKRMTTQQREQRAQTREANKRAKAAKGEHERRSEAAKKGWAKLSQAERSERALRGWETRDMRYGRTRKKRQEKIYGEELRSLEQERLYGRQRRNSNPFSHLPRGDGRPW